MEQFEPGLWGFAVCASMLMLALLYQVVRHLAALVRLGEQQLAQAEASAKDLKRIRSSAHDR